MLAMSLRVSPFVPAVSGVACALGAAITRGNMDAVIMWACAAFFCVVVSLALMTRPKPAAPSPWCEVCEQRPGLDEFDGLCSDACLDRWNAKVETDSERDEDWHAHH